MTDKAVSALTSLTGSGTATGDLLYIVDISEAAAADRSKKITAQELQNYMKKFPATIAVGNATPAASGAGITFPATASASSDANTLDDYEEGTISSLSLLFGGNNTGMTGTFTGTYTKIGNKVTVQIRVELTAKGSSTGVASIGNLPFTAAAFPAVLIDPSAGMSGLTAGGALFAVTSGTTLFLMQQTTTGRAGVNDTNFTNSSDIRFGFTYLI
jgi:hypothetical protein